MKNNLLSILIIALASVLFFENPANAQIKYGTSGLLIGDITEPYSYYGITAATNGIYFKYTNSRFLQLDVAPAGAPRIAGHNNQVVFYNTSTSSFNAIQVSKVLNYSDARAKTGIQTFNRGLDVIKRLRPVSYNFIGSSRSSVVSNQYSGNNAELGLLAQELEEVLPNSVFTDDEGKKLVDYISLIPVLIDAVQTLQQEIESLKTEAKEK